MALQPRQLLLAMLQAAITAALPEHCVPPHLPSPPRGRTVVVGAGKASAAMARAVEGNWSGELSGLIVTRYGHVVPTRRIEIVEAAHPVPDASGRVAAERILRMVQGLTEDDLVLCLISGGGSALLALPASGLTLEDKQAVNKALLRSGAAIGEMNCVRKHLSAIKGGRLALAAAPARVVTLMISDVPNDDPAVIASGPTAADPTTAADALAILEKYRIDGPQAVLAHLRRGYDETPKPGDERLARVDNRIIATPLQSLEAAIARHCARHGQPGAPPCAILSGGETTVTVHGKGRGGRNAEFLLALAVALDRLPGIDALAADTDGIDGTEDNAGAVLAPDSLARAAARGVSAKALLADNDGYGFFSALDDLVVTG